MPRVTKNSAGAEKSPIRCMVLEVESSSQRGISYWTRFNLQEAGGAILSSGQSSPYGGRGPARAGRHHGLLLALGLLQSQGREPGGRNVSRGNLAVKTGTSPETWSNSTSHSGATHPLCPDTETVYFQVSSGPFRSQLQCIYSTIYFWWPNHQGDQLHFAPGRVQVHSGQVRVGLTHSQALFSTPPPLDYMGPKRTGEKNKQTPFYI